MGFFSPYVYKSKSGVKYWLHMKTHGKTTLYFFSKEPVDAMQNLPRGFDIVENPKTGMPYLKKRAAKQKKEKK